MSRFFFAIPQALPSLFVRKLVCRDVILSAFLRGCIIVVHRFLKAFDGSPQVTTQCALLLGTKQQDDQCGNHQQFGNTNLTHRYLLYLKQAAFSAKT